jgi:hypothetical protein
MRGHLNIKIINVQLNIKLNYISGSEDKKTAQQYQRQQDVT